MGHRAAFYEVRVRRSREKTYLPLGDIDGQGSALLPCFERYLSNAFAAETTDGEKVLRADAPKVEGNDLCVVLQLGRSGVTSDLISPRGELLVHRTAQDTELLRCGCLFRLPPADNMGWLAAHVNNGQGVKGLLEKELTARFRTEFHGLILEITPFVMASVLREAIEHDRIDRVKLVKRERAGERANAATNKWVASGTAAKIELQITPAGQVKRVLTPLLRRFIVEEDDNAFGDIVEFQGLSFDEAKVEVVEPGGEKRTFNIEKPETGHPVTQSMPDLRMLQDGEPEETSLFEQLRQALSAVSG